MTAVNYTEVAAIALRAINAGHSGVAAVANHFDITYNAATHRVAKARQVYDIPKFKGDRAGRRWQVNHEGVKEWRWEIADPHRYALWLIRLRLSNQPHDGDPTIHAVVGIAATLTSQLADETGHDPFYLLDRLEERT